ncbi:protein MIS12 homolog [Cynara cardunculus var. scolymus]|nr:protein MIS12 homolog [Cynara cardunculus var. scolymus]
MEGSESEAIFDSLNLNPQLFINAALNIVDELIDSAFDHLHQEASTRLKIDNSDRAEDLTKGLNYIRNTIQTSLDRRLAMWEKYCCLRFFVVPEGFSLTTDNEASGGDIMDVEDAVGNPDLDAQLDSLRTKLTLAEQESSELRREIQALEKQSVISNRQATSINEVMKLSEQLPDDGSFKELQNLATKLRAKVERLKTERADEIQRARFERLCVANGDLLRIIGGNGLSNAKPEDIEGFLAGFNTR